MVGLSSFLGNSILIKINRDLVDTNDYIKKKEKRPVKIITEESISAQTKQQ